MYFFFADVVSFRSHYPMVMRVLWYTVAQHHMCITDKMPQEFIEEWLHNILAATQLIVRRRDKRVVLYYTLCNGWEVYTGFSQPEVRGRGSVMALTDCWIDLVSTNMSSILYYIVSLRNSILLLVLTIVSARQVSKLKYMSWLASKEPLSICSQNGCLLIAIQWHVIFRVRLVPQPQAQTIGWHWSHHSHSHTEARKISKFGYRQRMVAYHAFTSTVHDSLV